MVMRDTTKKIYIAGKITGDASYREKFAAAEQTLKGEYDLGFLPATVRTKENRLRAMLVDKVAQFMVELGAGFSYVGKGLTIDVGGDEFEIDLLFYHVVLHRYIVIELKTGKFHPNAKALFSQSASVK